MVSVRHNRPCCDANYCQRNFPNPPQCEIEVRKRKSTKTREGTRQETAGQAWDELYDFNGLLRHVSRRGQEDPRGTAVSSPVSAKKRLMPEQRTLRGRHLPSYVSISAVQDY